MGTMAALALRMHALLFGLKRSYWGSLKPTRRRLKEMGLTAARFDLLYVLLEERAPCPQRDIVRSLGVTPPVVSRMLKSLRELGLVKRQRCSMDRREWLISLTSRGRFLIRDAIHEFIESGRIERVLEKGFCPRAPADVTRENEAFLRMCELEPILRDLRRGFHAGGTLHYPWHPDD
jgi:DNA-binding MarR family transcriptional regulator